MSIAEVGTSHEETKRAYAAVICEYLGTLLQLHYTGRLDTHQGVCGTIGDWLHEWCEENDVDRNSEDPYSSPYNMWYAFKGEPMKTWPKSTGNRFYPVPHPDHMDDDYRECDEYGNPPYHATWSEYAYEHSRCYFEGEYGALRIELAKHTLQFFREMRDEGR